MTYASKTEEQKKNFQILLDGMVKMYGDKRFDDHFDMENFQRDNNHIVEIMCNKITKHGCHTAACLLGHGPIFGIGSGCLSVKNWDDYAQEFFGSRTGPVWRFLFSNFWTNEIQESITRLRLYIDGFNPEQEVWYYSDRYAS